MKIVRLPDGRTARLVASKAHRPTDLGPVSRGAKARVLLPSGAHLSVPLDDLEEVE